MPTGEALRTAQVLYAAGRKAALDGLSPAACPVHRDFWGYGMWLDGYRSIKWPNYEAQREG